MKSTQKNKLDRLIEGMVKKVLKENSTKKGYYYKNIKINHAASRETMAFTADLYHNGKMIDKVVSDGGGGMPTWRTMGAEMYNVMKEIKKQNGNKGFGADALTELMFIQMEDEM